MKYFGTDGIRQKAADFTPEFLTRIVAGLVDYAGSEIKVFLAGDTRESSEWILRDLETALETFGVEYSSAGVLPTPAINYCFYEMDFDFAIDVTASHNPYTDNGIKIFERGKTAGQKLSKNGCKAVEAAIISEKTYALASPTIRENLHDEAIMLYGEHIKNYLGPVDFSGLKIGLDCANGATSVINKTIFEICGAEVSLIHSDSSYGTKINHACGSTHLESLQSLVAKNGLDFGIAFDGDGDRVLMIDHEGRVVDGDEIIAIVTNHLKLDAIAITVMANQGLLNWARDHQITAKITDVGDSNVAAAMVETGIKIGGEQSGHIILPDEPTGDGMLTALVVTKIIAETKKSLHELASIITKTPQVIVNLEVTKAQKAALATSTAANDIIAKYNEKIQSQHGRLLVRPSGTENLIRITIWGDNENEITTLANDLKTKLGEVL